MTTTSFAADQKAPDFTVSTKSSKNTIALTAKSPHDHHFNTDAPMAAEISSSHERLTPLKSSPSEVTFNVKSTQKDSAKLSLYLCDDAKTFCERHQVTVSWEGSPQATESSAVEKSMPSAAHETKTKAAIDPHGFYDNVPDLAFAKARELGKPLMIDFYGIWCPPCNELNDRVFTQNKFKSASRDFVKLKIDADSMNSDALGGRYHVQGYPTVVFASPEGDEIGRVVGYRPVDEFVSDMKLALQNRQNTFTALKAKADAGDRGARDRIGSIYLDRGQYQQAVNYLKGTDQEKIKLTSAKVAMLRTRAGSNDPSAVSEYEKVLKEAVAAFPMSVESIQWREDLAHASELAKNDEGAKKIRVDLIAVAKKLLKTPDALIGHDMEAADLYSEIADASESNKDDAGAKAAWESAAALYRAKIDQGATRGGVLEYAYCLRKLGRTDEAEKLYQNMQRSYPKEFTYWLADAKMNLQLKRYERAKSLAQKAFRVSYGANQLDSALILAKAWKGLNRPAEGKKIISRALEALPPLPPAGDDSTRSRIQLRIDSLTSYMKELDRTT